MSKRSGIFGPFWEFWELKKITVTGVITSNRRFVVTDKPKLARCMAALA